MANAKQSTLTGAARGFLVSFLRRSWVVVFLILETVFFCFRVEGFANLNSLQIAPLLRRPRLPPRDRRALRHHHGRDDLSVGYVLGFASIVSIKLIERLMAMGLDPALALLLGAVATLLIGLLPGLVNGGSSPI